MKDKIFHFLTEDLDEFELRMLKRDLEAGGQTTLELVDKRIRMLQREHQKECLVCGRLLQAHNYKFILHFGPDDFLKRATFCAADCLEYFLKKVKNKADGPAAQKIASQTQKTIQ